MDYPIPQVLPAEGNILGQWHGRVVILLVVVHPDFSRAPRVPGEDVSGSSGKSVRMLFPENVTDATARDDL